MKKILLLLIIGISLNGFAQELSTANADTHLSGISGTDAAVTLSSHIDVVNASSSQLTVVCKREILLQEAAGATERFCWGGLCFANGTEVSPLNQTIPAGATAESLENSGFTGYYEYNGEDGVCQIKYTFYELDNEDNATDIIVHYCVGSISGCQTFLGTDEVISEPIVSQVSPNPASDNFLISYELGAEASDAKLVILDALGKVIKSVDLRANFGVVNFDATEFETGMYFYTLTNGGAAQTTKRFIVSH